MFKNFKSSFGKTVSPVEASSPTFGAAATHPSNSSPTLSSSAMKRSEKMLGSTQSLASLSSAVPLGQLLDSSPSATWGFLQKYDIVETVYITQFFVFNPMDGIFYAFPSKDSHATPVAEIRITYCSAYRNTQEQDTFILMIHGYNPYNRNMRKWMLNCKSESSLKVWLACMSRYLASSGSLTYTHPSGEAPNSPPSGSGYVAPPRFTSVRRSVNLSTHSAGTLNSLPPAQQQPTPPQIVRNPSKNLYGSPQKPERFEVEKDRVRMNEDLLRGRSGTSDKKQDNVYVPVQIDYDQFGGIDKDVLIPTILCHAARNADIDVLADVSKQYPDLVSIGDYDGRTPLHIAVSENQYNAVETLLIHGANVGARDRFNHSPLFDATKNKNSHIVRLLRKSGAEFSEEEVAEVSVLASKAAFDDNVEFVKLICQTGIDLNLPGLDGRTAVHMAVSGKCVNVLKFFIETLEKDSKYSKVKVNVKDRYGRSPLDDAKALDWAEGVQLLETAIKNSAAQGTDYSQFGTKEYLVPTMLCYAARTGDIPMLEDVAAKNPDLVSAGDYDLRTPLHIAVCENQYKAVEVLLKYGALDITATVFYLSLGSGASVHSLDRFGHSPFFDAVNNCFIEVALLMIDAGGSFTDEELTEVMALASRAAFDGNVEIVRLICQSGVDLNVPNSDGRTAVHMVCAANLFLLPAANGAVQAVSGKRLNVLQFFVECAKPAVNGHALSVVEINLNSRDRYGRTPLDDAMALGWDEGIECIQSWMGSEFVN
ncbi:hypothetical protein HDU83_005958 [Entophlyctis luteolus]|nr:hypothetical protein HDU83_005958 [Entophlyctis luteolus]